MQVEQRLADYVVHARLSDAPPEAVLAVRSMLCAVLGAGVAGAREDGVQAVRALMTRRGGAAESSLLVFGDRMPAGHAAMVNGMMCRSLDYCDAMAPGLHIGSSLIPAALAVAEKIGGCSGEAFMAALLVGAEVASRFNLDERAYNGFDPTGVAGIFGATAAAGRLMQLSERQVLHALALAFNRCSGSFQSNVDGSLAVRTIQGWVAGAAVECAELASVGLTGPSNFINGIYGYRNLYGKGQIAEDHVVSGLGETFRVRGAVFKKYPSCGLTQAVTELALHMRNEVAHDAASIESVDVFLPTYAYRLVGHPFAVGTNPRVNAQFSAQYCVANALIKGRSALDDFHPAHIEHPEVMALIERISVHRDEALDQQHHTAAALRIMTADGAQTERSLEVAPGFPGNELDAQQHRQRFDDCWLYAGASGWQERSHALWDAIQTLETLTDIRSIMARLCIAQ